MSSTQYLGGKFIALNANIRKQEINDFRYYLKNLQKEDKIKLK